MSASSWEPFEASVPVFPLPNLVMFPRAVQFLHIFEPRYQAMMQDVLAESGEQRLMATGLLKAGHEAKYHTNHAEMHEVLCLCEVIRHEPLDDGRYNVLVRGRARARITREDRDGAYRRAEVELLENAQLIDETAQARQWRFRLRALLTEESFQSVPAVERCREWLESDLPLGDLTDLLAFYLLDSDDVELRQTVLGEGQTEARADLLLAHLATLGRIRDARTSRTESWPPEPGMN